MAGADITVTVCHGDDIERVGGTHFPIICVSSPDTGGWYIEFSDSKATERFASLIIEIARELAEEEIKRAKPPVAKLANASDLRSDT